LRNVFFVKYKQVRNLKLIRIFSLPYDDIR